MTPYRADMNSRSYRWQLPIILPGFLVTAFLGFSGLVTSPLVLFPMFAAAGLYAAMLKLRTDVVAGDDGITTTWLGMRSYLPYSRIERVETVISRALDARYEAELALHLVGGGVRRLVGDQVTMMQAASAVNERLDAYRQSAAGHVAIPELDRGDRDRGSWVERLTALGNGALNTHRDAAVPREELWRIVETPGANSAERGAAAVAIAKTAGADKDRERLRIATDSVADPSLRTLIEAVAEEEASEEEVARRLEKL